MFDSRPVARGWRLGAALVAAVSALALGNHAGAQSLDEVPARLSAPSEGSVAVLVQLRGQPAAVVYGRTFEENRPAGRAAATAAAVAAGRTQIALNRAEQATVEAAILRAGVPVRPLYSAVRAVNGLAYLVDPARIPDLAKVEGVASVIRIDEEFPTVSSSIPSIGAPTAWSGPSPLGVTGSGIKIGIIDTGVDYQHATFGGTGLLADYQANDRTVVDAFFPNARVVGGYDFAGDSYTGSGAGATPAPDPDPMDCNGHGTHVASTAAGGGVNADGTPFTGPYDGSVPFGTMRLGPGVAPQANVYALRVFGCTGSTFLTVAAIEWSLDPNGDSDMSDRLDVINMSLGSNYGSLGNASSIAADNAARMGVIVVASAGNAGDTYTISGSPGAGQRVISTAAVGDEGLAGAVLRVNAPTTVAGNYTVGVSTMVNDAVPAVPTAPASGQTGDLIVGLDAANASGPSTFDGCTALTNAAAVAGKVVMIDRGTCGFAIKYQNARDAGAIGLIIANNAAGAPINMSGTVVGAVPIPAVMVSLDVANALKARLTAGDTVNVTFLATTQKDVLATFSSRGPRGQFTGVKPDLAAPGLAITAAQTGVTCTSGACQAPDASGYRAGSQNLVLQGTSMAAPHAAGQMALMRQRFPDRSVEELKAMAMNTSLNDVYQFMGNINRIGVDRSGAGRIDPVKALQSTISAFNADEPGAVHLAFFGEVVGTATQTKRVRVVNYGTTDQTFNLNFDIANDAPGMLFSLPGGSSITVPAGSSVLVDVQVDATAALMNHVRDVSADATQTPVSPLNGLGALARHYLTNKSGYLNLMQGSTKVARVPVYAALRPASELAAPSVIATGGNPTGSTTLTLSGPDVCTGTLGAGPSCTGTFPVTDVSRVSAFELQASGPAKSNIPAANNIRHVGVAYDAVNNLILFGIATWGDWASPTDASFNVFVDNNSDGTFDRILFNGNTGTVNSSVFGVQATGQDVFINLIYNIATNGVSAGGAGLHVNRLTAAQANSALFGNNVIVLAATPAQLGLASASTPFRYKVQSCFGLQPLCGATPGLNLDELPASGYLSWGTAQQGLNFNGTLMAQALNGTTVPVTWNTANLAANQSSGALLLHHHNSRGKRAQVITLEGVASADIGISQTITPAAPVQGSPMTLTVTVRNNGGSDATGVVASVPLPPGLTHVSDTGAGAYAPASGTWTIGALANGAEVTLSITANVVGSGSFVINSAVTSAGPTDNNSANNSARTTFSVATTSQLAVSATRISASPVVVGGASTFEVQVRNTGVDPLFNVVVNVGRSPAATIASSTPSTGSMNNATGVWSIASLAGGASATLSLQVTAPASLGTLTVTGNASAENAAPASQFATVEVISPANVTASKTVSSPTFSVGSTVTYTVTLNNASASAQFDNPGAEYTDVLPSSLTLVSATASSGTAVATPATNTVTWNGSVAGSGSVTITITATVKAGTEGTTVSSQGTVNYDADGNGSNEANRLSDDPGVSGTANPTVFVVQFASVSATKTVSTGSPTPPVGSTVTYTITLTNSGNATAPDSTGPEMTDVLPAQLALVSATASSGTATADVGTNTVTWNGAVPAGGSVTITITATIRSSAGGQIVTNQASIAFDSDLNGSNETTRLSRDPRLSGTSATVFSVEGVPIPTLSSALLIVLAGLLCFAGARRRMR